MNPSHPRTVFLHGRPPHPFHRLLASSVEADHLAADFWVRWHDQRYSWLRRNLNSVLTSRFFPQREVYQVFLTEGPHTVTTLMKAMRLLKPGQRTVGLIANETCYFLLNNRYSRRAGFAMKRSLLSYDALICVGKMQAGMAQEVLRGGPRMPHIFAIPNCVPTRRTALLSAVRPALHSDNVLYIAGSTTGWRSYYKGVDLVIGAIERARAQRPGLSLSVLGEFTPEAFAGLGLSRVPTEQSFVRFLGPTDDLSPALSAAGLYVHLGRGDSFPTSVLEAMCAGVPALVSEWTGAKEAVEQVDPRLVVPLDAEKAAERIAWYLGLPLSQKEDLSARSRAVAALYSEERSVREFRAALQKSFVLGSAQPLSGGPCS
jgi:glycosyltransferase involved in cell wall biosynthesis